MAWAGDGKSFFSYHQDRQFRAWDAATGKEQRSVALPASLATDFVAAQSARLMPDGKALYVSADWSVRVLNPEDGKELRWFGGHTGPINTVLFSPDGKQMATVGTDRHARVWDAATAKTVAKLPLPAGGGRGLAFDPDGKFLAVGSPGGAGDRTVRVFDLASAKEVGQIDYGQALNFSFPTFALGKDGKALYLSAGELTVRAYDVGTGKALSPPAGHAGPVQALVWSPDGKRLATAGQQDRSIILWDVAAGKMLYRLPPPETAASTLMQFTPDGKALLSYGADRTARAWDVAEGKERSSFVVCPVAPYSFAFSRDGKLAAVAGNDRVVRVWDVAQGKELHKLEIKPLPEQPSYIVAYLSFVADNRTLLGDSPYPQNPMTRRWDAVTGKELVAVKSARPPAGPPAGTLSAASDGRSSVQLLGATANLVELATGRVRQSFVLPPPPPPAPGVPPRPFASHTAAALAPDGRTVATVTTGGGLHFWDTGSGKELAARQLGQVPFPLLMSFAPDGKTLATTAGDGSALLWDVPGPAAEGRLVVKDVTADKLDDLWKDLGGEDAARAWKALLSLESVPKEAVPFVQKQLKPAAPPDAKQVAKLIADLDAEEFQQREDATQALVRAGKAVEEAVKKALDSKPSAEAKQRLEFVQSKLTAKQGPNLEEVRAARAVELLERVGTSEAQKLLEEFAKGGEGKLTAEARAAAERLKAKTAAP